MPNELSPIPIDGATDLNRARAALQSNVEKFETAMEHLADKLQETSYKAQTPVRVVRRWKTRSMHYVDIGLQAVDPYVRRAVNFTSRIKRQVRTNPQPMALIAGGLLFGFVLSQLMVKPKDHVIEIEG